MGSTSLIGRLATKEGSVVVLVDEYDKPILDCIADILKALAIRDLLRGVYTILKAQDENLRFVFLTGVTRFSKVSVFSGLNQLDDISQDRRYATVLGYTQAELESDFSSHLQSAALELDISVPELLVRIRDWYNGYRFHSAAEAVYNPFSCLLYLEGTLKNRYFRHPADSNPLIIQAPNLRKLYFSRCP